MTAGSDTERGTSRAGRESVRDPAVGRAGLGAFLYCVTTGLGVGAFCGEPLVGTLGGLAVAVPTALWLMPAAVRERCDRRPPVPFR